MGSLLNLAAGGGATVYESISLPAGDLAAGDYCVVCGDPATFVHEVQGSGVTSPLDGEDGVIVEAIVVDDCQDKAIELGGFFIQEEDGDADADPLTSEGIFGTMVAVRT